PAPPPRPTRPATPGASPSPAGPPRACTRAGCRACGPVGGGGPGRCGRPAPAWSRPVLQQLQDSLDGDTDPVGPVVQLVPKLVQRLVQDQRVEQDPHLVLGGGEEPAGPGRLQVGLEEGARHPYVPEKCPRLQERR